MQVGVHFGRKLCRCRLFPAVEEAGPESAGAGCPLGGTLCHNGSEVSVDVGGELRRVRSVRERKG